MGRNKRTTCLALHGDFIRPAHFAHKTWHGGAQYCDGAVFVCLGMVCKFPQSMEERTPDCFQLLCPDGRIGYVRIEMYGLKTKFRKVT